MRRVTGESPALARAEQGAHPRLALAAKQAAPLNVNGRKFENLII
jgi:hypothetical protein